MPSFFFYSFIMCHAGCVIVFCYCILLLCSVIVNELSKNFHQIQESSTFIQLHTTCGLPEMMMKVINDDNHDYIDYN